VPLASREPARVFTGIPVSPGIAVGQAVVIESKPFAATGFGRSGPVEEEVARFRKALGEASGRSVTCASRWRPSSATNTHGSSMPTT